MTDKDLNQDPKALADFASGMKMLKDFRKWAYENNVDPWVIREVLVFAFEFDNLAALEMGIPQEKLDEFDAVVKLQAKAIASRPGFFFERDG